MRRRGDDEGAGPPGGTMMRGGDRMNIVAPIKRSPTREIFDNIPQLPLAERDRRWSAIRSRMSADGIDCLLVIGNDLSFGLGMVNIRYMSQIAARHGGYLLFPLQGEPAGFIGAPHMSIPTNPYALGQDWLKDVAANHGIHAVLKALRARVSPLRKLGIVSGANRLQPDNIPHLVYKAIVETLSDVEIVDASGIIFDLRIIKSEVELDFLRRAGKLHEKMVEAMIDSAAPGVSEAEVYAAMMYAHIRNGGEAEIFNLLHSGPTDAPEQQHLLHGLDPNISPTQRILRHGDTIISETHSKYGGYMTQAEMTVCVGEPPDRYKRIFDAAVECLHAATEKLKPGNPLIDALNAEKQVMRKYGLDWVELGFHGHGLGSPEDPTAIYMGDTETTWPNAAEHTVLKENMVLATNIDIHDPAFRSDVGVMYCNTVIVKPKPEILIDLPETLPIKM
jgi:Xaa-Pro aminopeptidase